MDIKDIYQDTEQGSYLKGYEKGKTWDDPWTPGGPWYCNELDKKSKYYKTCKHLKACNDAWLTGFKDAQNGNKNRSEKYPR